MISLHNTGLYACHIIAGACWNHHIGMMPLGNARQRTHDTYRNEKGLASVYLELQKNA